MLSALIGIYVRQRLSSVYSQFWHDARPDLREALKSAHQEMQAKAAAASGDVPKG